MEPVRSASSTNDTLDAQAAAFAELLGRPPHELDDAWRKAAALAEGLFPHQVEGVAFLLGRRRAILADDMGLGKTRQAIVALRHASPEGPFLVVCPASVKRNWAREIAAVAEDSATLVLEGSTPLPKPSPCWTVVNYDILSRHIETLAGIPWTGIVFDEAHYLKNHTSARSKLARQLVDRVTPAPAVYLLTGTPLTNRPRDLFVPLQLVGHSLARSFLSFARRYCDATRNDFGWQTDGASNLEELALQLHGVMLRRSKDTVLSLPPKLRTWLPVGVPEGTGAADIRSVIGLLLGGDTAAVPAEGEEKGGVRTQVVAHLTSARQKLAVAKAGATQDFVAGAVDQGEKVIVFSCFDEPLRKLEEAFGDQAVVLTGRTPVRKRQGLVDRFQTDDQVRVFLANIIAGGVGVNLTAASQVVFNDLDWVPANHWQAEDRAYRIGQTRTVNVTYVVGADTIDEWVQAVLETKAQLVSVVVEGEAFSGDLPGNVLDELQRALRRLSPGLSDAPHRIEDDDVIDRLLKQAAAELRSDGESRGTSSTRPHSPEGLEALRKALEVLSRALSGPSPTRYRIASSSQPGVTYVITADDTDVECTCPGFQYRGQCRHAREVKAALAAGRQLPAGYRTEDA